MKKKNSLLLTFAMVLALVATLMPNTAYAATRKVTVKYQDFTCTTSVMKKKSSAVKKGTNKLTISKGRGYVKFTAPAKKTYTFTMSGIANKKASKGATGYWYVMKDSSSNGKYHWITDVTTKGGKTGTLWNSINGTYKYKQPSAVKSRYLASRYAKVSLKKGQTIYLYMNFSYDNKTSSTATLKIS